MKDTSDIPVIAESDVASPNRLARQIAQGANVNKSTTENVTPLVYAAMEGNLEAARLLLAEGADPSKASGSDFDSPLAWLIHGRHRRGFSLELTKQFCSLLFAHGASPNGPVIPGKIGGCNYLPIYIAAQKGDYDVVKLLLEAGADADRSCFVPSQIRSAKMNTNAFQVAQKFDDQLIMVLLLRHGASDESLKTYHCKSPFQASVFAGKTTLIEYYVRERGEDPSQKVNGISLIERVTNADIKALLLALQTEVIVQNAIGPDESESPQRTQTRGVKPL